MKRRVVKQFLVTLLSALICACATAQRDNHANDHHANNHHANSGDNKYVGEITAEQLLNNYSKFKKEFDSHIPEVKDVNNFKMLKGSDLVVFFGVWCHDSQREVPRLLKLIDTSGVNLNSVTLIAINQKKELPQSYQDQFKVKYTPTFFVLQQQQVIAKLVEKPKNSITQDLLSQIFH